MNGDGNYSDLIYVPNSQDEMTFVDITDKSGAITYSAVDQAKDFWDFVNNDSYLKDRKGKYVERYNRQIKKFPTEKQNVSLKHILT